MTWLWGFALVAAAFAAHWGAEQLSEPLKAVRQRYGIAPAAGGVLVALASASSDVAVNTVSAVKGVGQIGLGNLLGSNVVSIPLVVIAAYFATRRRKLGGGGQDQKDGGGSAHRRHVDQGLMRIERGSVTVVALPYLGMVALFALLTAIPAWRGLQPVDGFILLGAYLVFLVQAVVRGRSDGQKVQWSTKKTLLAVGGLAALTVGAVVIVTATQRIAGVFGIPPLVAGLFLTATMTALPAAFTTWAVTRSGQVTSGVSSPFGDNTVALTLGALPLAVVGLEVQDYPVYLTVLVFVALMPAVYALLVHRGRDGEHGLGGKQVAVLVAVLAAYAAATTTALFLG